MSWHARKQEHLTKPLRIEKEFFDTWAEEMPLATKEWYKKHVDYLKGNETPFDAMMNRTITKSNAGKLINLVLNQFGRSLSGKPVTHLSQGIGKATIMGAMGWIPRQLSRNYFQKTHNLSLASFKNWAKSFRDAGKEYKELREKTQIWKDYQKGTFFEDLPPGAMKKFEKAWLAPYQWTAVNNIDFALKAGYHQTLEYIKKPKHKDLGWADPKRTSENQSLFPSERAKLVKEMENVANFTQYWYTPTGMPAIFKHKTLAPLTRLQSWWMNYFFKYGTEVINRAITGKTREGLGLPKSIRNGYWKYILMGGALLNSLGYTSSYLWNVLPDRLSPAAQLMVGVYNYTTGWIDGKDWKMKKAEKQILRSGTVMIPTSNAAQSFYKALEGNPAQLFFYGTYKKEKPRRGNR